MNYKGHTRYLKDSTAKLIEKKLSGLKSKASVRNYTNAIDSICNFSGKDFCEISKETVEKYLKHLKSTNRTDPYIIARFRMLRSIARYIDGETGSSLALTAYSGHEMQADKLSLTKEDVAELAAVDTVIGHLKKKGDDQLIAIIGLALECGLPTGDIIRLKCSDIHLDTDGKPYIKLVDAKETGSWIREFPLKEATAKRINDLVAERGDGKQTDAVFVDKWGAPLTHRAVQMMLKKAEKEAGIAPESEFTIQKLNNLAVIGMIQGGADADQLSGQLGHVSTWFSRYKSIADDLRLSAVGLNCIRID